MELEIVSTQTIAPSSPTPDHLKRYTLSIFDQLTPPIYVPVILFYGNTGGTTVQQASDRLKKSLSLTLTSFFPFAAGGSKIRDNTSVDCTDEGVTYREARVNCNLRDVLAPPDMEALGRLLPIAFGFSTEAEGSGGFLLVQQSVFVCGGIAVGICFSHKIADAATIFCFLKSWAAACASGGDVAAAPYFTLGSLFPPFETFAWSTYPCNRAAGPPKTDKCTTRRFVLSASKVAALKAKSCSASVSNPTRIEAVSSLIWQCAMRASSASQSNNIKESSYYGLRQTVNLRRRVNPPLPDTSFGNFVSCYISKVDYANDSDLPCLAKKMRDAKEEYMEGFPTKLRGQEGLSLMRRKFEQGSEFGKDEFTSFWFTSWCKFGLYEADFGWGKPSWTCICQNEMKNGVWLLDARDGEGIEAWVSLPEDVMTMFEQDHEFLSFASPNPNVVASD